MAHTRQHTETEEAENSQSLDDLDMTKMMQNMLNQRRARRDAKRSALQKDYSQQTARLQEAIQSAFESHASKVYVSTPLKRLKPSAAVTFSNEKYAARNGEESDFKGSLA
ncbi:hypothetical protein LTS18_002361 [Coniosporium uncinatum]|uniref:Uncharacterized protein n=1 Tax=Coniosporium uncinatum TaxID=93489 RepID=A0ACC3DE19_9PEZI|nr:hypothetical protein LTS18_002361 [Coniosporium uncinatum]